MKGGLKLYFLTPIVILKLLLPGALQCRDGNSREMKRANAFPQIQGMIKSWQICIVEKCLWWHTLLSTQLSTPPISIMLFAPHPLSTPTPNYVCFCPFTIVIGFCAETKVEGLRTGCWFSEIFVFIWTRILTKSDGKIYFGKRRVRLGCLRMCWVGSKRCSALTVLSISWHYSCIMHLPTVRHRRCSQQCRH